MSGSVLPRDKLWVLLSHPTFQGSQELPRLFLAQTLVGSTALGVSGFLWDLDMVMTHCNVKKPWNLTRKIEMVKIISSGKTAALTIEAISIFSSRISAWVFLLPDSRVHPLRWGFFYSIIHVLLQLFFPRLNLISIKNTHLIN